MDLTIQNLQTVFNDSFENCPTINMETAKMDIPSWDSMSHLNLILNLEEAFGHSFNIEEIENIKSVSDIFSILA